LNIPKLLRRRFEHKAQSGGGYSYYSQKDICSAVMAANRH